MLGESAVMAGADNSKIVKRIKGRRIRISFHLFLLFYEQLNSTKRIGMNLHLR